MKPYPWMGGRTDGFEYLEHHLSAEERWIKTQVVLRKLEHDWKERTFRLRRRKRRRRRRNYGKLGMRLLALSLL
jgi:fatty acid desaturase